MTRVTRAIEFCYGHRLLDYDGPCAHPHGHNGRVEVTLEVPSLDRRSIAVDFAEIKRRVKGWIDTHLDHRFLLRKDDPLAKAFDALGEPYFPMDTNPTAEAIAALIFRVVRDDLSLPVVRVRLFETPSSSAEYGD